MGTLSVHNLTKRYGAMAAVDNVSLDVEGSELVALLGPSGCGKTTLLRMIAGFVAASEGEIFIGGRDVTRLPPHKRDTGMVFQSYALFPHLTVSENVAFGLEMRGVSKDEIRSRVADALELVRLDSYGERYPRQLSGGQQQRVAIARALVIRPDVFLLDEPLSNLDAKLRQSVGLEIRSLQKMLGLTTVFVTHDQNEALALADRLVVMDQGAVRQIGSADELYLRPNCVFVASFLGQANLIRGRVEAPSLFRSNDGLAVKCDTSQFAVGSPAVLCLRPEHVEIGASAAAMDNSFAATATATTYLGASTDLTVRTEQTPTDLLVQVANKITPSATVTTGEKTVVGWSTQATLLIRED